MTALANEAVRIGIAASLPALVRSDGSAAARHVMALAGTAAPMRDLADAIHALCVIHGAFPGIVDHALVGATNRVVHDWLVEAAEQAAAERALLARLTAAIGPQPSTPGQAASHAAVLGQRNALGMLARSDRAGCAIGTAFAFVLDWSAVRHVLDQSAGRTGIDRAEPYAPHATRTLAALNDLATTPAVERAMTFGAQQMLAQHRGLWQLLEARAQARQQAGRN